MKATSTVKLTKKERTNLSKFLMVKSKAQFPKQDTEQFSRIINMLGHPGKKEFTAKEFNIVARETKVAARSILKIQAGCLKIIEMAGKNVAATISSGNAR